MYDQGKLIHTFKGARQQCKEMLKGEAGWSRESSNEVKR